MLTDHFIDRSRAVADAFRPVVSACLLSLLTIDAVAAEPLSFNRDIRPILSEHCWKCHGFDAAARQGGLRLDDRHAATQPAESGQPAIVPGQPNDSELWRRVSSSDPSVRMPPAEVSKRLTPRELELLRRWIAEGAVYEQHWAFQPIRRPSMAADAEHRHPVDALVAARLRSAGLSFAPEADPDRLIRRVYFDLIGLPPTESELALARVESWDQTVDRLLASPHFGERMAVDWLDAARYADTDGYFGDKPRQMWLWRDWVIEAFNRNLPFAQFTLEQLAGDLLPDATISQKIATGFNRNHMSNDESGLIDEEFRVEYVADRVDTTMSIWLGLTVGCAQCHDHKYDPISQREYYQLFAFFNNVPEQGLLVGHDAPPRISVPSAGQERQLATLSQLTSAATSRYEPLRQRAASELKGQEADWLEALRALSAAIASPDRAVHVSCQLPLAADVHACGTPLKSTAGIRGDAIKFDATQHLELAADDFPVDGPWTLGVWLSSEGSLGAPVSKIQPAGDRRGLEVLWQKGRIGLNLVQRWGLQGIEVVTRDRLAGKTWQHLVVSYDGSRRADGVRIYFNGRPVAVEVRRDSLADAIRNEEPLRLARRDEGLGFYGPLDEFHWLPILLDDDDIAAWSRTERTLGLLERPTAQRSARDAEWLLDQFIDQHADAETQATRDAVRAAKANEQSLRDAIPLALVMAERDTVRPTHILERGVYNQPRAAVEPDVPAALLRWPDGAPRNRVGLARWLTDPNHPLFARVAVNRLWRQCFGEGLVRTVNDFGTQGEPPTHPDLLDELAATFRDSGWDVKALLRLIVTSRTYRQSSQGLWRDGEAFDPENRWLARGPRFRLPMEMLRDQALSASGLLVRQLGGPSVKPFQPPGLWEDVSYNAESSYEIDAGPGRYRRSLYTFLKRQAPPPALLVFDGPTREKCTLCRPRTNTPLQALVLLNDETYVEAARALAVAVVSLPATDADRIGAVIRRVLSREPQAEELPPLRQLLQRSRDRFANDAVAARQLAGDVPAAIDVAAWTVIAQTLFNLDEAITRR